MDLAGPLPDFPWASRHTEVGGVRMAYLDEGPPGADPVLLIHGEPTWSYLWRTVLPRLLAAGHRVVVPDLVGFGRSEKPADPAAYTYANHLTWVRGLIATADLRRITLVCQDWGGLLGLRIAAEDQERFDRIVAANTGLPAGDHPMPPIWHKFRAAVRTAPMLDIGRLVAGGCVRGLSDQARAAYDLPFPDEASKVGVRAFPELVPTTPDDPQSEGNRAAWQALTQWTKPFLCPFSDSDPITGAMGPILQRAIPGAAGRDHPVIARAGHFLQEDAGPQLGAVVADFIAQTQR